MKMIHITHNDLDGVGCAVLGELFAESQGLEYEVHNVKIGDQDKMIPYLDDISKFADANIGYILVSDLPISEESAEVLNKIYEETDVRVRWVDHHKTNVGLGSKFPEWALVQPLDNKGTPVSATMLLYWLWGDIIAPDNLHERRRISSFSNIVSRYDTWEWKNHPTDYSEEDLNILLRIIGIPSARKVFYDTIKNSNGTDFSLTKFYQELVKNSKTERDHSIRSAIDRARYIEFYEFKVAALIPSEQFGNAELTALYELPDFNGDFVVGLYPTSKSISFRSSPKSDIDLSGIAKRFGGGGHPSAAGAKLTNDQFLKILRDLYESDDTLTAE